QFRVLMPRKISSGPELGYAYPFTLCEEGIFKRNLRVDGCHQELKTPPTHLAHRRCERHPASQCQGLVPPGCQPLRSSCATSLGARAHTDTTPRPTYR